jgi:hypothetical protein
MLFFELERFSIRERTWSFMKSSRLILLAQSPNGIYWMVFFHDRRTNLSVSEKFPVDFIGTSPDGIYWMKLFHNKRTNLTVYERLPADFIGTQSGLYLLNETLPR